MDIKGTRDLINDIDYRLRSDSGLESELIDDSGRNYVAWYSQLLSSYAVMLEGETLVAAFTIHDGNAASDRFLLWTDSLVIDSNVAGFSQANSVETKLIARSRLSSMSAGVSAKVESLDVHPGRWPGKVTLRLDYEGLDPIVLTFPGTNEYDFGEPSDGMKLLRSVRADLP